MKRGIHKSVATIVICGLSLIVQSSHADWTDLLKKFTDSGSDSVKAAVGLSNDQVAAALKEALSKGVQAAVKNLGQPGGFLANTQVKIPMPKHLGLIEDGLRRLGQDAIADDFVESMNHAAERAVPEAASVFAQAISQMSIDDAKAILNGGDNAATEYLRRTSSATLKERFSPLVDEAINKVGVTSQYQKLTGKNSFISSFIDTGQWDLNGYVTDKALDGVFFMVGEEEKNIRENPAARTTDLLKKVFGN